MTRGRSPGDPAGPIKHVSRMGQSRGKPLREGEPISVSWPKVKAKHFKCPTDWGKIRYTGAGSPYTFKLLKQSLTDICNHWVRNLCQGLTSSHHSTKSLDTKNTHHPP
ncbi:hypothetical protein QL285_082333 [Trifolium repens]|nr:hypothetical protein QL285_082333 [Trifolium repens]